MKKYTIAVTRTRTGSTSTFTGTIAELVQDFSYTLDVGKSWEHEAGNKKINTNPKTIKSLISNIYNAKNNAARDGYAGVTVDLVKVLDI